jgi:hypothetical protein
LTGIVRTKDRGWIKEFLISPPFLNLISVLPAVLHMALMKAKSYISPLDVIEIKVG